MRYRCLLLGVVLLSGCGRVIQPAAPQPALLSEVAATDPQCQALEMPDGVSAPSEFVDTAMLARLVSEYWSDRELAPGHVLLTLTYDAEGVNIRRQVIEHSVVPLVADSVQKLVFASLRAMPERGSEWGVRFRIDVDTDVSFRVGPREYCPPRPRDPELDRAVYGVRGTAGPRYRRGVRERVIIMRVWVHPGGYVAAAEVRQGAPQGGTLERNIADFLRRFAFYPARVDGIPTIGAFDMPVVVRD